MAICRALLKYGYSNFSLEVLEYCSPNKLLEREKYYFELFKPEYNISQEPGSPMLGRNHSSPPPSPPPHHCCGVDWGGGQESKAKMGVGNTPQIGGNPKIGGT